MFTEKGVIPFGLEALVDRPAFIHHTPRPPREETGKRDGNSCREQFCQDKNRPSLPPFLPPFFRPSVKTATTTTCPPPPPPPPSLSFEPIDVYLLTKAAGNGAFLTLPRGKGGREERRESRMHFVRRSWKISYSRTIATRYSPPPPPPPSSVWPRYPRRGGKSQAFRVFSKGSFEHRPATPIGFS